MKIGIWAGDTVRSVSEPYLAHSGTVNVLSWSPDGGTLASGGGDGAVCLWETNTGRYLRGFKGDPVLEYTGIAWSPDGKMLALGSADGVLLWTTAPARVSKHLVDDEGQTLTVAWSPDGKYLASGTSNGSVSLWEFPGTGLVRTVKVRDRYPIKALAWSPGSDARWQ